MQTKAMLALERFKIADEGGLQNDMSWRDRCIGPTEHNGCSPAAKDAERLGGPRRRFL